MKRLYIIGIGTRRFQQMTLESLEILKKCGSICFLESRRDVAEEFCQCHGLVQPEDLSELYRNGARDIDNYHAIAREILLRLEKSDQVAFLVAGHPRLGVYLTSYLSKLADQLKWFTAETFEGVSSFDVMTNVLGRDSLERGTALVDINRAILFDHDLDTNLDHYFYHVCSVLNPRTDYQNPEEGNRIDYLQSYLAKHYPPSAKVQLVTAATDGASQSRVIESTIGELVNLKGAFHYSTTLFVPALKPTKLNREVLEIVRRDAAGADSTCI